MSAKHVLSVAMGVGEAIAIGLPSTDPSEHREHEKALRLHLVTHVIAASDLDLALGEVPDAWSRPSTGSLPIIKGDPRLGTNVLTYDVASHHTVGWTLPYTWKGYILALHHSQEPGMPRPASLIDVSIPVVQGMSGAPLVLEESLEVCGILFGNIARQIVPAPLQGKGEDERPWYLPIGQALHAGELRAFLVAHNLVD